MSEKKGIWIITAENVKPDTDKKGRKGGMFNDRQATNNEEERGIVATETLQKNLEAFLENIDETLAKVNAKELQSGFKIEEIELSLAVDAKGKIGLWGIGAETGGNVAIKLKLKQKNG